MNNTKPNLKQQYQSQLLSEIAVLKQYTNALQLKNKQLFKQKQDLQAQLRNIRLNFKNHSVVNGNQYQSKYASDTNLSTATHLMQQNQIRQKYQRLLMDYNRLKNKARSTKTNYDIYQKQNTNLSKQKYVLQQKVVDLQTEVKAVKSMNNSLLSNNNNNQSFEKSYYANPQSHQQNLNTSMSYQEYETRHLTDKIQELQNVISMKNQEIAKYQAQLNQKNEGFNKMRVDIQNYYQKMTELQNELNKSKTRQNITSASSYIVQQNSQTIQNLNQSISILKDDKLKLQQKNQILQNRIQILEEANLNLTKQLRDKSAYYQNTNTNTNTNMKMSDTLYTSANDWQMTGDTSYRLIKSIIPIPSYQEEHVTQGQRVPSYYLGEVQSRFVNKKTINPVSVVVRQNALYNNNNNSITNSIGNALRGTYKKSVSNDSLRYNSLQRKIQNLAVQNNKLRKVLISQL